jgi:phosphoribosylanthranilate isomerase
MSDPRFIVKICGITNEEDARVSLEAGANVLGFNFYEKSPRYVTPLRAREIIAATEGHYLRAGIFVNASQRQLLEIAARVDLDILQLHGQLCPLPLSTPHRIWRAVSAMHPVPPAHASIAAWVLDAPAPNHGGSGETFDWNLAARFPHRVIVAGGLDPSNVAEAIRVGSPWGVDACSRLESAPGKKDAQRVRDFVRAALTAVPQEMTIS